MFVHHLGKPPQGNNQRNGPAMYGGLGSSDIINWTRETIMLTPEHDGLFKMELGKRAGRAGFSQKWLRHSHTGIRWEKATGIETQEAPKESADKAKRQGLADFIRHHELVTLTQMQANPKPFGYSKNTIKLALDALSQNSITDENPIHCFSAHVNNRKFTQTVYSIHPPTSKVYTGDISQEGSVEIEADTPGELNGKIEFLEGKSMSPTFGRVSGRVKSFWLILCLPPAYIVSGGEMDKPSGKRSGRNAGRDGAEAYRFQKLYFLSSLATIRASNLIIASPIATCASERRARSACVPTSGSSELHSLSIPDAFLSVFCTLTAGAWHALQMHETRRQTGTQNMA